MINDQLFIHIKNQRNLSPLKRYYPKDVDQICYLIYFMVLSHEIKVSQIAGEIRRHLIAYGFKECQSNYDRKTTGHGGYTIYPPIPSKAKSVHDCAKCGKQGTQHFNGKPVCQKCYWRLRKQEQRRIAK